MFIPCERVIKDYLPALRAATAAKLVQKHGYSQVQAASALGITQAAVSKYLSGKPLQALKPPLRAVVEHLSEELTQEILKNKGRELRLSELCKACTCVMRVCEVNRRGKK